MFRFLIFLIFVLICVNAVDLSKHYEKYATDARLADEFETKNLENFRKEVETHGMFQRCWDTDVWIFNPEQFGLDESFVDRNIRNNLIARGVQNICIPKYAKEIMGDLVTNGFSLKQFSTSGIDHEEHGNTIKFFESLGFLVNTRSLGLSVDPLSASLELSNEYRISVPE